MTRGDAAETRYRILKALLSGKLLRASVSNEMRARLSDLGIPQNVSEHLVTFEKDGIISGYAPILSEKGLATFKALKTLYGDDMTSVDENGDKDDEV